MNVQMIQASPFVATCMRSEPLRASGRLVGSTRARAAWPDLMKKFGFCVAMAHSHLPWGFTTVHDRFAHGGAYAVQIAAIFRGTAF